MIGYTTIGAKNLDTALAFYDALFAELGGKRVMDVPNGQLYGFAQGPLFGVVTPHDGKAPTSGNGAMIALNCGSPDKVTSFYDKAISLGGTDEGPPGDRGGGFHAAYFRDLDGNKIAGFCMQR